VRRAAALGLLALASCAWLKSNLPTIEADLLAACPIACDVVTVADPSQATLACAIISDAGDIIQQLSTITGPAADIKTEAAKHPSLAAIKAKKAAAK
jgi:hypothetical protein